MNSTMVRIPTKLAERILMNQGMDIENLISDLPLTYTVQGKARYPLQDMEVGQHFFVHNNGRTTEQTQNAVNSSVGHATRKYGRAFHQRRYRGGIRVWRIR
jgi:antitoxin component of MazEF toxin-antitoxin module